MVDEIKQPKINKYKVPFPPYKRFHNCLVGWTIQPRMRYFLWISTHAGLTVAVSRPVQGQNV